MRIRDPGWRQFGSRIRDPGWEKVGSGIRDKHPGSATLWSSFEIAFSGAEKKRNPGSATLWSSFDIAFSGAEKKRNSQKLFFFHWSWAVRPQQLYCGTEHRLNTYLWRQISKVYLEPLYLHVCKSEMEFLNISLTKDSILLLNWCSRIPSLANIKRKTAKDGEDSRPRRQLAVSERLRI